MTSIKLIRVVHNWTSASTFSRESVARITSSGSAKTRGPEVTQAAQISRVARERMGEEGEEREIKKAREERGRDKLGREAKGRGERNWV